MFRLGHLWRLLFPSGTTTCTSTRPSSVPLSEFRQPVDSLQLNVSGKAVSVILLGHTESCKTFFTKPGRSERSQATSSTLNKSPTDVCSMIVELSNKKVKIIDSPDFDNPGLSLEAFTKLADYFLHELHTNIAGIIYIHPASDSSKSKALARNLSVLFEVFLGDSGLSRLTVFVVPDTPGTQAVTPGSANELSCTNVFRTARNKGAKFLDASLDRNVLDILTSCASQEPILLRIQQESIQSLRSDILDQIKARLNGRQDSNQTTQLQQVGQQLADSQEETAVVRRQLKQIQKEYATLRSQLQLHENVEQGEIIQTLKDLNRSIDDLSRSISQHVVDTYATEVFGKDLDEVTALDAHHLFELKELFGYTEEYSSLVSSSGGQGMPIEDFIDYGIRNLLCKHLFERIFNPFHPAADSSQNKLVSTMYSVVQREEPQAIAAKWRANCFKSIYTAETRSAATQQVDTLVQSVLNANVSKLFALIFGEQAGVRLEDRHVEGFKRLYVAAWDWNSKLKGDVIMLGDFYPTYYEPTHRYNPKSMEEFDPGSQKSQSEHILGTLGLGLTVSHAVGGGRLPEETTVFKAIVAMPSLYA